MRGPNSRPFSTKSAVRVLVSGCVTFRNLRLKKKNTKKFITLFVEQIVLALLHRRTSIIWGQQSLLEFCDICLNPEFLVLYGYEK